MTEAYTPLVTPDQSLSFTQDGDGNILELIMDDEDGNLHYRDGGQWVRVGEEDQPGIYDRDMIEVDPELAEQALQFWDENAQGAGDVTAEQVYPFERMYQ